MLLIVTKNHMSIIFSSQDIRGGQTTCKSQGIWIKILKFKCSATCGTISWKRGIQCFKTCTKINFLYCACQTAFSQILLETCSKLPFCFLMLKYLIRKINNFWLWNVHCLKMSHGKVKGNDLEKSGKMIVWILAALDVLSRFVPVNWYQFK